MPPYINNFYKETLAADWAVGIGNRYVTELPGETEGILVISPASAPLREIIRYNGTGTDSGGNYVTVTERGVGDTTDQEHFQNEPIRMNFTAEHWEELLDWVATKYGPGSIIPAPTLPTDVVDYGTLLSAVLAGATPATIIAMGIGRISATPDTTLGNPTITIATPGVVTLASHGLTAGDLVKFTTSGLLPTGIVSGTSYYVIATGLTTNTFQISATFEGAAINTSVGQSGTHTLTKVTPVFVGLNEPRLPTQDENDAIAGTSGNAVGPTNKLVDESDPRIEALFGGDGSDGDLTVASGTTTLDLSVKSVYNYNNVTIALGATLTFSNGTAGDKVPVFKIKGNFTNAGTITGLGLGVAGGAGGALLTNGTAGTPAVYPFVDGTVPSAGNFGTSPATTSLGGALANKNAAYFYPYALNGSGGAGGAGGKSADTGAGGVGGAGGAGGIGLYMEIVGNFTNSGTITLRGSPGVAGSNGTGNGCISWGVGGGGVGGGGGGGSLVVRYKGTYSQTGTIITTGGTAGAGGTTVNLGGAGGTPVLGGSGGGGSGGATAYNSSLVGGNGSTSSSSTAGGAGSAGGDGITYLEKVK